MFCGILENARPSQSCFFFRIRPEKVLMGEDRWRFVSTLLATWCELHDSEQCFLVEVGIVNNFLLKM